MCGSLCGATAVQRSRAVGVSPGASLSNAERVSIAPERCGPLSAARGLAEARAGTSNAIEHNSANTLILRAWRIVLSSERGRIVLSLERLVKRSAQESSGGVESAPA